MAKKTFIVAHPKLMLSSEGKLVQMEKGAEVEMEAKHAASLVKQGKLLTQGEAKALSVGKPSKKADVQKASGDGKEKPDGP